MGINPKPMVNSYFSGSWGVQEFFEIRSVARWVLLSEQSASRRLVGPVPAALTRQGGV